MRKHSVLILVTGISLLLWSCIPDFPLDGVPIPGTGSGEPEPTEQPWPSWIFEHWVWEDESTQSSAVALVEDYLARDIPVGAVIIDSPWETGYNTGIFDTDLFPDAQAMIDHFHDLDVRVLLWITGVINVEETELYAYAEANQYFMQATPNSGPAVISWWKGQGSLIDFFNEEAVEWWAGLMDEVIDLGIDGWKCDGTDYFALLAPWSPGANSFINRNQYSDAYYRFYHAYTRQELGYDRVNLVRSIDNYGLLDIGGDFVAFSPTDITWAGWVGDQDATFDGLKKAMNNMFYSAAYGYLSFGSDIGGYRENDAFPGGRSKELFIRWAQMAAFNPIMENGGGGEHRPWMFDEQTESIYRTFTDMHYRLIPYMEEVAIEAWAESRSMMTFKNKYNYAFLLGDDVFVTPILDESGRAQITFPDEGTWLYVFDEDQAFEGGSQLDRIFSLEEFPVFVRANSRAADLLLAP